MSSVSIVLGDSLEEILVKAEVNKTVINKDDLLRLNLQITGNFKIQPEIIMPKLDGFKVVSTSQASEFSLSNNKFSNLTSLTYFLVPAKTGELLIPEIKVKYKNKEYSTQPIKITVEGGVKESPTEDVPVVIPESEDEVLL